jgi:hypothetical protein
MDSSFTTQPISSSSDTDLSNESNSDQNNDLTQINQFKDSRYNQPTYQLPSDKDSLIYIFQNNLFTRSLLPIDYNTERKILIQCTTCSYKKVENIKGFQASNFARHYKTKHKQIAYNKESEKDRQKKTALSNTVNTIRPDFFNITSPESRKRTRNNTITEFDENQAYTKILTFIIENNLSFNILNSEYFKDLLSYYNKSTPVLNRWKIKTILEDKFNNYLSTFNDQLRRNVENNGLFSTTLDIWTSKVNQTPYLGIIITYIDIDFKLNYKLIGFDELTDAHSGKYIYNEFINILTDYPSLPINNIFSITRDNASNNNTFLDTFKTNYNNLINKEFTYDIRCTTHIINLVITDILRDYLSHTQNSSTIISRIRRLATIIKYNQEPRKLLFEGIIKYKHEGILPSNFNISQIPLDNNTRWNSTYYMIKKTLELKEPLIYIAKNTENNEFKELIMKNNEWEILIELRNIFEIFVKPTIKLQGQIYTTLNHSLLYIYKIYNKLNNFINLYKDKYRSSKTNYFNSLILAIKSGIERLDKYFPQKITSNMIKRFRPHFISLVLDPRLKLIHFKEEGLLFFYPLIK